MDRRRFLGYSALGGATLLSGPIGCAPAHAPEDSSMTRRPATNRSSFMKLPLPSFKKAWSLDS